MKTRLVSPFKVWALIASSLFPFNPLSMIRTRLQRLVNIATYKHLPGKTLCANVVIQESVNDLIVVEKPQIYQRESIIALSTRAMRNLN